MDINSLIGNKVITNYLLLKFYLWNNIDLRKEEDTFGKVEKDKFLSRIGNDDFINSCLSSHYYNNLKPLTRQLLCLNNLEASYLEDALSNFEEISVIGDYYLSTFSNLYLTSVPQYYNVYSFYNEGKKSVAVIILFEGSWYLMNKERAFPLNFTFSETWKDIFNRTERIKNIMTQEIYPDVEVWERLISFDINSMGLGKKMVCIEVIKKNDKYETIFKVDKSSYEVSHIFDGKVVYLDVPNVEKYILTDFNTNFSDNLFSTTNLYVENQKLFASFFSLSKLKLFVEKGFNIPEIKMSFGKLLKKYLPDTTSEQIEALVNAVKAQLEPPNIEIVSGYGIAKYYNGAYYSKILNTGSLIGSCMKYDCCQLFFGIYVRNTNVRLLIIKSPIETNKIIGRALIWENVNIKDFPGPHTVVDRFYGPDKYSQTIKDLAKEKGWWCKEKNCAADYKFVNPTNGEVLELMSDEILVPLEYIEFKAYPYLDTFNSVDFKRKVLYCGENHLIHTLGACNQVDSSNLLQETYLPEFIDDCNPEDSYDYEEDSKDEIYDLYPDDSLDLDETEDYYLFISSKSDDYIITDTQTGLVAKHIPTIEEIKNGNYIEVFRPVDNKTLKF